MSTQDPNLDAVKQGLQALGDAIEQIASRETPPPTIPNRSLSGNQIHGGKISKFASIGIEDHATKNVIRVDDNGLYVDSIHASVVPNDIAVQGILTSDSLVVKGEITAQRLHVNEITSDVRQERSSPLEFTGEKGPAYGKGLIFTGGTYTKQFLLQAGEPDKFFSTESIDLLKDKSYMIQGLSVLSQTELGSSVTSSNLRKVGTLENLAVEGNFNVDNFLFWNGDFQRLGLGTENPNGAFSIASMDHEFIVDSTEDRKFKIGTFTTGEIQIVTDDTPRISVAPTGKVTVHNKTSFLDKVGIGAKNFAEDVDLTVAGPVRIQEKKFEVGDGAPTTGNYVQGDIVWNAQPRAGGTVGWICVRDGTPGIWKTFGPISS
jgi:hypothetical protein